MDPQFYTDFFYTHAEMLPTNCKHSVKLFKLSFNEDLKLENYDVESCDESCEGGQDPIAKFKKVLQKSNEKCSLTILPVKIEQKC